jgi:hypothetical protein
MGCIFCEENVGGCLEIFFNEEFLKLEDNHGGNDKGNCLIIKENTPRP